MNELHKIFITRLKVVIPEPIQLTEEADRKYRVTILMQRSDRPRYWTFHCPNCQTPLCEMLNTEILAISDTLDMQNINNAGNGRRCDGRYQGGRCGIYYYFILGN